MPFNYLQVIIALIKTSKHFVNPEGVSISGGSDLSFGGGGEEE